MPEPSLSEIVNIPSDAALGTAGLDAVVTDSSKLNAQIYDAAKFKAAMDWQRYTNFLNNFKEITKEGSEIEKMDLAPNDRAQLQGQMADIFAQIAKDPKSALGGKGMFDIQQRLNKLQSDATLSKQDNMFDKYHRAFLDRTPDMKTDENKAKVESYLRDQKLGTRQPYILDAPQPEFDAGGLFGGLLKQSTKPFSENYLNPKDAEGKVLQGYIQTETGDEVNPKAVQGLWNLALKNPKTIAAIQKRYDSLPPETKKQYEQAGGLPTFFSDLGKSYLAAQFPEGSYTPTKEGNYRFNKKSQLVADPNYLKAQQLAEKKREFDANLGFKKLALATTHPKAKDKTGDGYAFGDLADVVDYDIAKNMESEIITAKPEFNELFYQKLISGDKRVKIPARMLSDGVKQKILFGQKEKVDVKDKKGNILSQKEVAKTPKADQLDITLNDAYFEIKDGNGNWVKANPSSAKQMQGLIKNGHGRIKVNFNKIEGGNINEQRNNVIVTGNDYSTKQKKGQDPILETEEAETVNED